MTRPTSNNPKKRRMRSRLRERLDDLLAQKPLPIRQERQAAPQVRLLESRFVLDASAALVGLDALSSGWEAQTAELKHETQLSTEVVSQGQTSSMEVAALDSGQSISERGKIANAGSRNDVLGLELGLGADLTGKLTGALALSGPLADPLTVESDSVGLSLSEVGVRRDVDVTADQQANQLINASDADVSGLSHDLRLEAAGPSNPGTAEIVFIDAGVQDYETLAADFREGVEVLVLDGTQDGVQQIAQALEGKDNLEAIHLVSHGSAGSLQLGSTELSSESMTQYADALSQIGSALTDNGDLMLYGCDVAQGEIGQAFISALATATDADIAASNDRTGNAGLSGDWELESSSGDVGTATLIDDTVMTGYAYVLAQPNVLSVEVNDTSITDSDAGNSFEVTVTFDQPMDTGGAFEPTLSFDPDVFVGGTLTNPSAGVWSVSDTVFTKTFDVVDVGVEVANVEIDVSGAQSSGNEAQTDYTPEAEFSIDTLNPTVTVSFVEVLLTDGSPSSVVTFEFSEDVVGFDETDLTPANGLLSGFSGTGSSYQATFTADDGVDGVGSVTVGTGYTDLLGNTGSGDSYSIAIDTLNPTVESVVRANADYTNAASVDFTVTFSENVTGVDLDGSDFSLVTSVAGASIVSVSGSDSVYTVTVGTGSTDGSIGLALGATPTIQDAVENDLTDTAISGANEIYTIASTEVLLTGGDVSVADIRDATADDLTLSVVGV
ncbi:MAG: DUF4347 domain-containing protein, partial [Rubripirellula sp.]